MLRDGGKEGKNKSQENVASGDLIMLRRNNILDQPQFGLVLELLNHSRDTAVKLQSEYSFFTVVGNLILVASGNQMEWTGKEVIEALLIELDGISRIS